MYDWKDPTKELPKIREVVEVVYEYPFNNLQYMGTAYIREDNEWIVNGKPLDVSKIKCWRHSTIFFT